MSDQDTFLYAAGYENQDGNAGMFFGPNESVSKVLDAVPLESLPAFIFRLAPDRSPVKIFKWDAERNFWHPSEEDSPNFGAPLPVEIARGQKAIPCACGGYCDLVDSTEAECKHHGCGLDSSGNECCAVSFSCRICGNRYAGSQPAPEYVE
jgi:hypothetical protein